ncbi:3-dehydrosphinganine reductase [Nematocida sp. AWRm77]|nr:3-dehydrosphinganine reductase [Nematocida sp. AWRm77]
MFTAALGIGAALLAGGGLLLLWRLCFSPKNNVYFGKHALVIGGSSGLGLSLAHSLQRRGASVTITSRDKKILQTLKKKNGFGTLQIDVTQDASVKKIPLDYDFIFCCAGFSIPSLAEDITVEKIHACMETNFYGTVRVFLHFYRHMNMKPVGPKKLVFVSSTLGLHSFTGYGAYAPSKASLSSFYESVKDEASLRGLSLAIYYVSTINSPGLEKEDKIKPHITKVIEGQSRGPSSSCENRADTLLNMLPYRSIIVSDTITQLFMQSTNITSLSDYLAWRVAPLFWIGFRHFTKYHVSKELAPKHV